MIEGHDYTIYSNGPGGRARMYALLAMITAFLTPIVQHAGLFVVRHFLSDTLNIADAALFFGGFTALIIFGLLINLFNNYLWRTEIGGAMFRIVGLPIPPRLSGNYEGSIQLRSAIDPSREYRTSYSMRIAQTWEQIGILVERESEHGGHVRVHSDLASVRVGMMSEFAVLRFVYTFEENVPRREGAGVMAQQFSGAATFSFRMQDGQWLVEGHFFDDVGRSGQVDLTQIVADSRRSKHDADADRPSDDG